MNDSSISGNSSSTSGTIYGTIDAGTTRTIYVGSGATNFGVASSGATWTYVVTGNAPDPEPPKGNWSGVVKGEISLEE